MDANKPLTVSNYKPEAHCKRILLCNPPVYDTRFPWSQWHQPVSLLQLSTLLQRQGDEVRLFDTLSSESNAIPRRRRMRVLTHDGISLNWWRFGRLPSEFTRKMVAFRQEGWQPDDVYIEGFTTFWWEGVAEMTATIRKYFPHTRIILFGAYPRLAPDHAAQHSNADILVIGQIEGLAGQPLDLSLYPSLPPFTYLSVGTSQRPVDDLVHEFLKVVTPSQQGERVWKVAFADHDVVRRFPKHFRAVLQTAIDQKCKVSFFALGNLHPCDLAEDPELPSLLLRAGFKQLVFADDRALPFSEGIQEKLLDDYRQAIAHCLAAGYPQRTEALVASVSLGRRGEDPAGVVTLMTKLAHIVGSLIVVPYQPTPTECHSSLSLEMQNGKLFPFAEENHMSFRGYQDILGLAAMFNAKYRDHTFDFLGDGLISRLVRESLVTESWNPHNSPGFNRPVTVGWFNKEGKWVRS
jgi:hypothetical protein